MELLFEIKRANISNLILCKIVRNNQPSNCDSANEESQFLKIPLCFQRLSVGQFAVNGFHLYMKEKLQFHFSIGVYVLSWRSQMTSFV